MKVTKLFLAMLGASLGSLSLWASAQTVTAFVVVNADNNTDLVRLSPGSGSVTRPTKNINVRAEATGVTKVVFTDSSTTSRTEVAAPYAYKGDSEHEHEYRCPWPAI